MCSIVYVLTINSLHLNLRSGIQEIEFITRAGVSYWIYETRHRFLCISPVCGIMHIKEPLLLIGKSNPCGSSGFPLSLSEWSINISLTLYNRK